MVSLFFLSPLYRVYVLIFPQPALRMDLLSPDFCRTFLPGSSTVPLAEAVMFLIGNPSNTSRDTGASARVLTGLMREVIAYIGNLTVVATDLLHSLPTVGGTYLLLSKTLLAFDLAL